jgi:hypothetical protein
MPTRQENGRALPSEEKIDSRLTAGVPLTSQEHYDLIAQFERDPASKGFRRVPPTPSAKPSRISVGKRSSIAGSRGAGPATWNGTLCRKRRSRMRIRTMDNPVEKAIAELEDALRMLGLEMVPETDRRAGDGKTHASPAHMAGYVAVAIREALQQLRQVKP